MARLISCCCLALAALATTVESAQLNNGLASVSDVSIRSVPLAGDTYGLGETIALEIRFDRPVQHTGPLLLPLQIGVESKNAAFGSCTSKPSDPVGSCRWFWFHYKIEPSDSDADGISLAADPLQFGGGTILDMAGNPVAPDLGSHAIANNPRHKVDGGIINSTATGQG